MKNPASWNYNTNRNTCKVIGVTTQTKRSLSVGWQRLYSECVGTKDAWKKNENMLQFHYLVVSGFSCRRFYWCPNHRIISRPLARLSFVETCGPCWQRAKFGRILRKRLHVLAYGRTNSSSFSASGLCHLHGLKNRHDGCESDCWAWARYHWWSHTKSTGWPVCSQLAPFLTVVWSAYMSNFHHSPVLIIIRCTTTTHLCQFVEMPPLCPDSLYIEYDPKAPRIEEESPEAKSQ